jgi:hypothetical protein
MLCLPEAQSGFARLLWTLAGRHRFRQATISKSVRKKAKSKRHQIIAPKSLSQIFLSDTNKLCPTMNESQDYKSL